MVMNDWWVLTKHSKTTRRQSSKPNKKQRANDKKKKARTKNRKIRNQTLKIKSWSKSSNPACYTNFSSVLFTKNRTMTLLSTWNVILYADSFKGKKNLLNTLLHTIPFLKAYQSCIPALIGIVNGDIASLINSLSYSTYNLPHIYLSFLTNCAN